jgi:hypothetical protein
MAKLSISKAWDETRDVLSKDSRLMASIALALILLPQAIADVLVPPPALSGEQAPTWMPILTLVVAIAGLIGQIAIIRLALGPATSVGDAISHGLRRLLSAFGALMLFALPLAILMVLILIAMAGPQSLENLRNGVADESVGRAILLILLLVLLVSVRFQLVMPVAAGESGGPIRILRRSWEITSGSYFRLLGFLATVLLAAIVVFLVAQFTGGILAKGLFGDIKPLSLAALVLALIVTSVQTVFVVLISTMLARIYVQLAGARGADVTVPSSGT